MKLFSRLVINSIGAVTVPAALLAISGCGSQQAGQGLSQSTTAEAPRSSTPGIVNDWSTSHVIFSDPGTEEDAIKQARYAKWKNIVDNPRYRMQRAFRNFAGSEAAADSGSQLNLPRPSPGQPVNPPSTLEPIKSQEANAIQPDWAISLRGGGFVGLFDRFPAKYTFAPIATPSCPNDFIVYGIGFAGASNQANVIGVNNLYNGTCTGTVPTIKFAYWIGNGSLASSPVLSLDGTKVVLVESLSTSAIFHVLTIGTTGNNGTVWSTPACPGTVNGTATTSCGNGNPFNNNAVDVHITMSGSAQVLNSSPYVDYTNDIAYIGDSSGKVHKFTGVFQGTPAEATTGGWPAIVGVGAAGLTDPVYDDVTQHLFIGSSDGNVYCLMAATGAPCTVPSITVGTQTADVASGVEGTPILDTVRQKLYVGGALGGRATLTQFDTSLGSVVHADMGAAGTILSSGAGDDRYYRSGTGYWYFCGNLSNAATPALRRVLVQNGVMSSTADSNFFQLVATGNTGTAQSCSPLTEFFNSFQRIDYLFLTMRGAGFATTEFGGTAPAGTADCRYVQCVVSFSLPVGTPPNTFPTQAFAANGPGDPLGINPNGTSGLIIDNSSVGAGAQIYYINYGAGTGVQISQSNLQ